RSLPPRSRAVQHSAEPPALPVGLLVTQLQHGVTTGSRARVRLRAWSGSVGGTGGHRWTLHSPWSAPVDAGERRWTHGLDLPPGGPPARQTQAGAKNRGRPAPPVRVVPSRITSTTSSTLRCSASRRRANLITADRSASTRPDAERRPAI